ncbi:hypothetical protein AUC70_11810 [Methyloceanibacter stevinii]|uniref:Uncharacterized protein n=1 Tax=Methyloceanibacter stevinii TaxID=1774970 RepID=A0A1E3VJ58_9HYPH|nr:hypothetical protein [Methyloceanibacter stevinii]ODR93542.1 hypothetical protein AUC70_11810 [Methyloceanibacter stevinii]
MISALPNVSLVSGLLGLVQGVFAYILAAVLGLGVGLLVAFVGRAFGYVAAATVCAVVIVALYAADAVDSMADARAQAEIVQLTTRLVEKTRALAAERATNAQLTDFMEKGREAAAHNATVMAELRARIEQQPVPQDCGWSEEFLNEVDKLR